MNLRHPTNTHDRAFQVNPETHGNEIGLEETNGLSRECRTAGTQRENCPLHYQLLDPPAEIVINE